MNDGKVGMRPLRDVLSQESRKAVKEMFEAWTHYPRNIERICALKNAVDNLYNHERRLSVVEDRPPDEPDTTKEK